LIVWFVWHTLKARKKGPPTGLPESDQAEINPAGRL
jgi:hypothetical protein